MGAYKPSPRATRLYGTVNLAFTESALMQSHLGAPATMPRPLRDRGPGIAVQVCGLTYEQSVLPFAGVAMALRINRWIFCNPSRDVGARISASRRIRFIH